MLTSVDCRDASSTFSHATGTAGDDIGQPVKKKKLKFENMTLKMKNHDSGLIKTQGVFLKLCVLQVIWILFTYTN